MKTVQSDARSVALSILNALETGRNTLDSIMENKMTAALVPDRRERALVTTLVYGVLRHRGALDWLIERFSRTPFNRLDPVIKNILRLGLFQIYYLDRIPDYAAVNAAVNQAGQVAPRHLSGFVNGVLRGAIRNRKEVSWPDVREQGVSALAIRYSLPEWLLRRWLDRYGRDQLEKTGCLINTVPPVTVRVNTLKTNAARTMEALAGEVANVRPGDYSPYALCFHSPEVPVDELTAFRDGWFQVQDEAAQLACRYFDPGPGETILDACAGRGGKTAHIAQLMNNRGTIRAVDRSRRKLAVLAKEMDRLGVTNVKTTVADLARESRLPGPAEYDRVFADCPCSGLGVVRKNPDTRWSVSLKDIQRHHKNQVGLLDRLAALVRPGGILLYAVCSREPEENEQVIEAFLNMHPEFDIDKQDGIMGGAAGDLVDQTGYFKSDIHSHGLDGFFGARLKKK